MCGIAGLLDFETSNIEVLTESCANMVQAMRHRGPDDNGMELVSRSPNCVMGHVRLAVIDLSSDGHQPMLDEESNCWMVFNGEIYNYLDLKEELSSLGHKFRTHTDSEVLLKAYLQWETACFSKLNGMFAVAIWDPRKRELIAARDRLGIKPFYYYYSGNKFYFASEVRALLASNLINRKLCRAGLNSFLTYGSVLEPYTLVENVISLPPASWMKVKADNLETVKYWDVSLKTKYTDLEQTEDTVREALKEAIDIRMVSDVPLGAFLSGGIDSTAIVAIMQRLRSEKIKTFSIICDDARYDEREYSRLAAEKINTDHTELEINGKMVHDYLSDALRSFDQPSIDGLNTWFVSKLTKEAGLTVALSGVGGDELFVGYSAFRGHRNIIKHSRLAKMLSKPLNWLLAEYVNNRKLSRFGYLGLVKEHPCFKTREMLLEKQIKKLLAPGLFKPFEEWFPQQSLDSDKFNEGNDAINAISWLEMRNYMLSTLLRDTDQMSMAHALEVRVPLIDYKLVECVLSIPASMKLSDKMQKPLLIAAASGGIPDNCIYRIKKGFSFPFETWFKEELQEVLYKFYNEEVSRVFSPLELKRIWKTFQEQKVSWNVIWALYSLEFYLNEQKIEP